MNTWRSRIPLRERAPSLMLGDEVLSGPDLLLGAERWAAAFRAVGLGTGDRLLTTLPSGACLAQVLLAGLWEGLTLVPVPPASDPVAAVAIADPRVVVAGSNANAVHVPWAWQAAGAAGPGAPPSELRPAGPPTPLARMLCPSSSGGPWAALLDDNLEHAVDAVLAALRPQQARWLSVLPWHGTAGVLLDLLPSLLSAATVVRPTVGGEPRPSDVANTVQRWQPTHTVLPIALVAELARLWGSLQPLRCVVEGLASGPGLEPGLAAELAGTRLRTHRGAPELSCMVTLGEPGIWRQGALGRPVDCAITDGPLGGLLVSGRPVAGGRWADGGLQLVDRRTPVAVAIA